MIKFYKNGDEMALRTDARNENELITEFSKGLALLIEMEEYKGNWDYVLMGWIPALNELVLAYRGYKAKVNRRVMYTAGDRIMSDKDVVAYFPEEEKPEEIKSSQPETAVVNGNKL